MWGLIIRYLILLAINLLTRPEPEEQPPPTADDLRIPNSEEGGEYPVIFGSPINKNAFIPKYGNYRNRAIRERAGKK